MRPLSRARPAIQTGAAPQQLAAGHHQRLIRDDGRLERQPLAQRLLRPVRPQRIAVDAVRQWEFDSTLLNCVPIEVQMNVSVTFGKQ